ncbi:MAG TPA: ATP-binding protein [Candidatus Acidoferrales bacterium]|jgi:two-component system NtrC family sensor kinase|nr:ATP-binding protein [Candidatus Acidoferrales bacterium]
MTYVSNPVLLAITFIEGSAALIVLIVNVLLTTSFHTHYFRYWLVGWTCFFALEASKIAAVLRGGNGVELNAYYLASLMMAAMFFAAAIECAGLGKKLKYYVSWGILAFIGVIALRLAKLTIEAHWAASLLVASLLFGAGVVLWKPKAHHRGLAGKLLSIALMLSGLHVIDRALWINQKLGLLRISLQGLLLITAGVAMAVLVLEVGRARHEELNEKLRRLSFITARATQSLRVEEALSRILQNLVESLEATHGLVLLRDENRDPHCLYLFASAGLNEECRQKIAHLGLTEPWIDRILQQVEPVYFDGKLESAIRQGCFGPDVASGVALRLPGKDAPLGLLAIGSDSNRKFQSDEKHFLANVVNLLGLTVQNISLLEAAADSRRQWRDTFDSIDDMILAHSTDGAIIRTNRAFGQRVHMEPVALVGKQVRDVLRRGTAQWNRCPYCEGVAGKPDQADPSFGGYFLVSDSALHSSEGGEMGTIHVLKDFTSMRLAENKFRNLFERAQEGVFIATPDGKLLDCNSALVRLYGCESREELLRTYTTSQFYADMADRRRLESLLDEHGQVADFEFQFRRRDGEIRTAHLSAFVTRDEAGSPIVYQGFVLDITERKHAESEIRRRNQELQALNTIGELLRHSKLADGLTEALRKVIDLVALDVGAVFMFNDRAKTLKPSVAVGFWADQFQRSAPIEITAELFEQLRHIHPTLLPGSASSLPAAFRAIQQQERIVSCQLIVLWSQDRLMGMILVGCRQARSFSAAEMNLFAAVGNQIATSIDKSVLLDQTREAYETLRHTQEQLLQSEKMAAVGQLISGVAHELNNPLTAILGYSQLLQSREFPEDRRGDYVDKLVKQAQRTHRIVQNLLSFARQHKPERTAVQVNKIVEDTLILREYDMQLANVLIHRELDTNLPDTAGDSHQLQQVFLNILNNAVDAVSEKQNGIGEIWIRTRRMGDRISVDFTNNGPPVQNPHRIFDPFYTTKPVGKGTGLGLSICYGIVKEHGGEIQVRNLPRGVTFTVTLPLISPAALASSEQTKMAYDGSSSRILLVESDESVLEVATEALGKKGISVRAARNGFDAIEILKQESFDAAILDVKLTGETSTSALYSWIEQNRSELSSRVIFTASSRQDPDAIDLPTRCGCALLTKPFRSEDLLSGLQKVLAIEVEVSGSRSLKP